MGGVKTRGKIKKNLSSDEGNNSLKFKSSVLVRVQLRSDVTAEPNFYADFSMFYKNSMAYKYV